MRSGGEVQPQVLGALSVVLRTGASNLRVSRKVWLRSSDRPTALPKRSLSDLVWRLKVVASICRRSEIARSVGQKVKAS